jgi:hypothetical protein
MKNWIDQTKKFRIRVHNTDNLGVKYRRTGMLISGVGK